MAMVLRLANEEEDDEEDEEPKQYYPALRDGEGSIYVRENKNHQRE